MASPAPSLNDEYENIVLNNGIQNGHEAGKPGSQVSIANAASIFHPSCLPSRRCLPPLSSLLL